MKLSEMKKPLIIAGPCMAESFELLDFMAEKLLELKKKLDFDLIFKASFDKANRTSYGSYRGPGLDVAMKWFADIKSKYNLPILTDIHETQQTQAVGEVCDVLQIPAFLCRQTDLVVEAVKTGKIVNIKKGQFMAPGAMKHIVGKVEDAAKEFNLPSQVALTERGASFGYGDLIVDMRSLAIMKEMGVPVIFDVTHSTQQPPAGTKGTSGALRQFAPLLARSAAATGYIDGLFIESHREPNKAKSDAEAQLSLDQITALLETTLPILRESKKLISNDQKFIN